MGALSQIYKDPKNMVDILEGFFSEAQEEQEEQQEMMQQALMAQQGGGVPQVGNVLGNVGA